MKKRSVALCSMLLVAAFTACNHDPEESGNPSIVVNTASLYEELGLDFIDKTVAHDNYFIVDTVLIYDQKGVLAYKRGIETKTLGEERIFLNGIPSGTYTFVLWQSMFVKPNYRLWTVRDEALLSSVNINVTNTAMGYPYALGSEVITATIEEGKKAEIKMTPKSLGCILSVVLENYTADLGYTDVAMVSATANDWYTGYYFNPYIPEGQRWIHSEQYIEVPFRIYSGNDYGYFFSLMHGDDLTMYLRGDMDGGYADLGSCPHKKVETGKNYLIFFDVTKYNWQPPYFGAIEGYRPWREKYNIDLPAFNPYLQWGSDFKTVDDYMQSRMYWLDDDGRDLSASGQYWVKRYWVSRYIREDYWFETESGQNLIHAACYCGDSNVPIEKAGALLKERGFIHKGTIEFNSNMGNPYDIFFSPDDKTEAYVKPMDNNQWCIVIKPTAPDDLQYITYL